ncbi:MAG TPA: PhnD/SsuA/transferrin family substrate-binding protein [Polyangiaceae bacterium]|nr:PhnD/SsuA/transferrin family substrate-binding protein [Polyangiaceae bacterium]
MYDGGDLSPANDALWAAVAERLRARGMTDVPEHLERRTEIAEDARLLFGQTCGYPFASGLARSMRVVAVPVYDAPGCEGTHHRSFIVVRADARVRALEELAGARAVINEPDSNTGRNLFGDALASTGARFPFFAAVTFSGSHLQSLAAVAKGEADVAAIDCVSHAHFSRMHPAWTGATRILHATRAAPSLPFITARENGDETASALFTALSETLADPAMAPACRILRLVRIEAIDPSAYDVTHAFAARANEIFGAPSAS